MPNYPRSANVTSISTWVGSWRKGRYHNRSIGPYGKAAPGGFEAMYPIPYGLAPWFMTMIAARVTSETSEAWLLLTDHRSITAHTITTRTGTQRSCQRAQAISVRAMRPVTPIAELSFQIGWIAITRPTPRATSQAPLRPLGGS